MIECKDSLSFLKEKEKYEFDIIYSDPPYALGSEVIIRQDGKVDYKKANDFMNKWTMPTGDYWEQWFKEAYRTLKHGGYCIMFGMDRQLLLFKYYANLAGFTEQQSLYWYFISNFPKATDLSKQIDKFYGTKGEIIGEIKDGWSAQQKKNKELGFREYKEGLPSEHSDKNIYEAGHDLAKKYEGYKYSISPLKQTNETIMVFQKPYKTGSCLHDTLAYENGDDNCCCGALDIDGNRVPTVASDIKDVGRIINRNVREIEDGWGMQDNKSDVVSVLSESGRYPSQTMVSSGMYEYELLIDYREWLKNEKK